MVPFSTLAFHPEVFAQELEDHLPFGDFDGYTISLADSLYFAFAGGYIPDLISGLNHPYIREAYDNPNHRVVNGAYTEASYQHNQFYQDAIDDHGHDHHDVADQVEYAADTTIICGIDPIQVALLKDEKWRDTYFATYAFEERLQHILSIGDQALLDVYTQNLDRDLHLSDQEATDYLTAQGHASADIFQRLADQQLTNQQGRLLLVEHCSSCHAVDELDKTLTGPALLDFFEKDRTKAWFMRFTKYSQTMIALGDPGADELWQQWGPTVMNHFPELTHQDLADIYHYLETQL